MSSLVVFSLGYIFGGAMVGVIVCLRMVLRHHNDGATTHER